MTTTLKIKDSINEIKIKHYKIKEARIGINMI